MAKGLRLSEKWFRRGLWLVAVVFAWFLVGLGGALIGDLPKVEQPVTVEDFMDRPAAERLRGGIKAAQAQAREAQSGLEQAQLKAQVARTDSAAARETFSNWLATRRATQQSDQDPELVARTRQLDTLRQAERDAQAAVERQQQAALDAQQAERRARQQLTEMEQGARERWSAAQRSAELRVFGYRLALTLPLLVLAGWLLRRHRRGAWWPFVWGFAFFAAFTFFVELVPYLPSYGGYVRYTVGIIVTVIVGRQAMLAFQRYLERQREAERMPDAQRRQELAYDTALTRLSKGVCPGCERPVDLKNEAIDFCPHCGIGLFNRCGHCATRKGAFSPFCHACGTPASEAPDAAPPQAAAAGA
jgi:predicted RNA-binding Zn-ribbon protein involved in translation (DUF1610 family)